MQVGGVGSGHDTYSHHVTSCLHEHGANTDTGSMGAKSGAAQTAQMATEALQENSKGNLLSWVQNIGNSGKQLLQKIWGDSKESNDAISSQKDGSGNHIAGQETLVTGNSVGVKTTLNRRRWRRRLPIRISGLWKQRMPCRRILFRKCVIRYRR